MNRFEALVDCRKEQGGHRSCNGLGLKTEISFFFY